MKRSAYILAALLAIVAIGYFSFTEEYHSRYNLDTLRQERFVTSRVVGIPVWRSEQKAVDQFSDTYTRITGVQPELTHWKVMPPDYIRSRRGGLYKCYVFDMEIRERMYLLKTAFERFNSGMPKDATAELIGRIDDVYPLNLRIHKN